MYIGIDLGTSSVKMILINHKQEILSNAHCSLSTQTPKDGYNEQNPKEWILATEKCLDILKKSSPKEFKSVISIGISGHMHGATLIDRKGKIIRPCILWNDTRAFVECKEFENQEYDVRKISGNIAMPGFTAPKINWLRKNEKENFDKIFKVLLPKDYLRFRLSNSFYTDMSDASGTLWLNVKERKWSDKLLSLTELSREHMPILVEGSQKTDFINKKLAHEIGFKNEVIIAGGAGDQAAGATGSGVIKPSQSVISLGTSGVYFSPTDNFVTNTSQAVHSFCHCIPDTWHHMSVMLSATNCIDWICKLFNLKIENSLQQIEFYSTNKFKNESTPYFLPYLTGERTPHNNAYLRGSFHLLDTSTTADALLYSVIEGISFGIKDGYEAVHSVSQKSNNIYLVGGGSKNFFWASMLSSLLNQDILIGENSDMGPALGVARLAMIATENYKKEEIIKSMSIIRKIKNNNSLSDRLDKRYKTWKEIVNVNQPIAKKIME